MMSRKPIRFQKCVVVFRFFVLRRLIIYLDEFVSLVTFSCWLVSKLFVCFVLFCFVLFCFVLFYEDFSCEL